MYERERTQRDRDLTCKVVYEEKQAARPGGSHLYLQHWGSRDERIALNWGLAWTRNEFEVSLGYRVKISSRKIKP